ncbi:hypothetical protein U3516DRAFT_843240 [Neocallimastix sp. 'constans']
MVKMNGFDSYKDVYEAIVDSIFGNWKYTNRDSLGKEMKIPEKSKNIISVFITGMKMYLLYLFKIIIIYFQENHKIPIFFNKTEYIMDNEITNSFYDSNNSDILTNDLMNIKAVSLKAINNSDSIQSIAYKMNRFLSYYIKGSTKFHNHWFVLDFSINDLVRKVYESINSNTLTKRNLITNAVQIDYLDLEYKNVIAIDQTTGRSLLIKINVFPLLSFHNTVSNQAYFFKIFWKINSNLLAVGLDKDVEIQLRRSKFSNSKMYIQMDDGNMIPPINISYENPQDFKNPSFQINNSNFNPHLNINNIYSTRIGKQQTSIQQSCNLGFKNQPINVMNPIFNNMSASSQVIIEKENSVQSAAWFPSGSPKIAIGMAMKYIRIYDVKSNGNNALVLLYLQNLINSRYKQGIFQFFWSPIRSGFHVACGNNSKSSNNNQNNNNEYNKYGITNLNNNNNSSNMNIVMSSITKQKCTNEPIISGAIFVWFLISFNLISCSQRVIAVFKDSIIEVLDFNEPFKMTWNLLGGLTYSNTHSLILIMCERAIASYSMDAYIIETRNPSRNGKIILNGKNYELMGILSIINESKALPRCSLCMLLMGTPIETVLNQRKGNYINNNEYKIIKILKIVLIIGSHSVNLVFMVVVLFI